MKIEVGKTYVDGCGLSLKIVRKEGGLFVDDVENHYNEKGIWVNQAGFPLNRKYDLVKEVGEFKKSDGGSTDYYNVPEGAKELNDLIEHKNMSFALGNIFKACYRFGEKDGAGKIYDLNKIIYFAERLKAIEGKEQ